MNIKIHKFARLLFAAAALLLGGILQRATGKDFFFFLGLIACVGIFGFLGRGEEFRRRQEQRKRK